MPCMSGYTISLSWPQHIHATCVTTCGRQNSVPLCGVRMAMSLATIVRQNGSLVVEGDNSRVLPAEPRQGQ